MRRETDHIERAGLVAAVEQAADSIVVTDTEGRIQYVNPAFTAMTGYTQRGSRGPIPAHPQIWPALPGVLPGALGHDQLRAGLARRIDQPAQGRDSLSRGDANHSRGGFEWGNHQLHSDQAGCDGAAGNRGSAAVARRHRGKLRRRDRGIYARGYHSHLESRRGIDFRFLRRRSNRETCGDAGGASGLVWPI